MNKLLILLVLTFFCLGVGKILHDVKDGFSPRRLQPLSQRVGAEWDEEINQALLQPFHYIGRGRQCFAFASADEKYVLKFPRTDIYKTPFWVRALPVHAYRKKLEADHKKRESFILESFQISFNELKEQTGLLALHLGQSVSKGKWLTLIDQSGWKHRLPLEKMPFVLQKKQPILMKCFLSAENESEAKNILTALIDVIVERGRKGILNRDRSFLRNYGFDGKKAYQIDVGSFFRMEGVNAFQKSVGDSMDPIQEWLGKNHPEMLAFFNAELAARSSALQ